MNLLYIFLFLIGISTGIGAVFFLYKNKINKLKSDLSELQKEKETIIEKAKEKAEKIVSEAEKKAEKIEEQRTKKIEEIQNKLLQREERLEKKIEELEQKKDKLREKEEEYNKLVEEQIKKLEEIAGLSQQEAKEILLNQIEQENQEELHKFIEKIRQIKEEEANKEARDVLVKTLARISSEAVNEYTTNVIDLPNEDYKGKLIGREGRNIMFFEKITGVELLIDDTPQIVRIASFDPEKRFIAKTTIERLIKDGRINPFHIERIYNQVIKEFDDIIFQKGKEALNILNLGMMKPEVVKHIGKFYMRFSYGQNLWNHSIEVAKIAGILASELGVDPTIAKKAGLLHDIGKVIASNNESHAKVGAEFLRKFGFPEEIVNPAESHHYEVPMTNIYSRIITAADALSASRPGARFDTKELFLDKMKELEELIMDVEGVNKVYIMQAGREIMVYVNPEEISDLQIDKLLETIGKKIENQLDYPGIIRITAIRESRVIQYVR